jgi:hypothetical protein
MNWIPTVRILIAACVAIIGVAVSHNWKLAGTIGETTFVIFVFLSVFVSLIIAFNHRLLSLSLRDWKLELAKVESARKDVEKREQSVRRIATALAEIAMFLAAFQRRFGSEQTQDLEVQWLTHKVSLLLQGMAVSDEERRRVFQYLDAVKKMDAIRDSDKAVAEAEWVGLWKRIEDEIHKAKKPEP